MIDDMLTASISTLRRKTMALLKQAVHQPILMTRYGKPFLVLMPVDHYNHISANEL